MTESIITNQLVKKLLEHSRRTLITSNIVAFLLYLALSEYTDKDMLIAWFFILTAVNVFRIVFVYYLRNIVGDINNKLIKFYIGITFLSGMIWGSLVFVYFPGSPLIVQLFFLITLVGVPMGSLPSNGYYLPCFVAFSLPVLGSLILWSIFLVPEDNFLFSTLAILYSYLLIKIGISYSDHVKDNIKYVVENKHLMMELENNNRQLATVAYKDPLTSLSNRREFDIEAMKLMSNTDSHLMIALLLIDVDEFKLINDTYGHKAGDTLLKAIGHRIAKASRESELILSKRYKTARIGGDEFLVLYQIPKAAAGTAENIAKRIQKTLSTPVSLDEVVLTPSLSIGVALSPQHSKDINQLIEFADKAMYQAKSAGGNNIVVYSK